MKINKLLFLFPLLTVFLNSCGHTHELVVDEGVSPTCTQSGLTEGSHCKTCGEILVPQETIAATGHTPETDASVSPTCTQSGLTEGSHCKTCGEILVPQETIEASGHKIIIDNAQEPTIDNSGKTMGAHCETCGEVLIEQTILSKLETWNIVFENRENGIIVGNLNQKVVRGSYIEPVKAIANIGYKFVRWSDYCLDRVRSFIPNSDAVIYPVFVEDTDPIPVIDIETNGGAEIVNKTDWIKCSVSTEFVEEKFLISNVEAKIKGRGNSTWLMPKKPYKIKFDSKQNFLGMGKAKNWVLLANYGDPSSMRSQFAYSSAKLMDSIGDFAVDAKLVEVKLNGNYIGLYNLTEAVEVNSNRVDIDDNVDNIDTGYLLELDKRAPEEGIENKDYIVVGEKNYAFKDPDPDDDLKPEQIEYIKSYLTKCYEVVCENSYEEVCEYLDVETFASEYVVQELLKSNDVGGLSFYFYKDAGGKLCNGPAWDFDIAMGNCRDSISVNTDCMYVRLVNKWYSELLKFDDFRTLVKTKLENSKDALR